MGRHIVNPNESKADRFKRLATQRTVKALKSIQLLGNLAGAGYESTPEQIAKIEAVLGETLLAATNRLRHVRIADTCFKL